MLGSTISQLPPVCRLARGAATLAATALLLVTLGSAAGTDSERIVIIRHAEKPATGDNLSCRGENRALALPTVLMTKFGRPDYTYVPAMKLGTSSSHIRMFQTVTPFAVKQSLTIDSQFAEDDVTGVAKDVLTRKGLVLLVWEHSQIQALATALGVSDPPKWPGDDFDSIWIVTPSGDKATLSTSHEGLSPSTKCKF